MAERGGGGLEKRPGAPSVAFAHMRGRRAAAGHGFGTRSMRRIVESHSGILTLWIRGDVFTLNALIPLG